MITPTTQELGLQLVSSMSGDPLTLSRQDEKLNKLRRVGVHGSVIHTHRAMATFPLHPANLLYVIMIPLVLVSASLLVFPHIVKLWGDLFLLALSLMDLPGDVQVRSLQVLPFYYLDIPSFAMDVAWPATRVMVITGVVTLVLFVVTFLFPPGFLPLSYLLRVICFMQLTALAWFACASGPFPYQLSGYIEGLLRAGIVIVVLVPLLYAISLFLFRMSLVRKLLISGMTMVHLMVFIPLQAVVHASLVHFCSFLVMPVMFFLFGILLDVLVIIAFYSWGMSWVDVTNQ